MYFENYKTSEIFSQIAMKWLTRTEVEHYEVDVVGQPAHSKENHNYQTHLYDLKQIRHFA